MLHGQSCRHDRRMGLLDYQHKVKRQKAVVYTIRTRHVSLSRLSSDFWKASRARGLCTCGITVGTRTRAGHRKVNNGTVCLPRDHDIESSLPSTDEVQPGGSRWRSQARTHPALGMGYQKQRNPTGASCSAARHTVVRQLTSDKPRRYATKTTSDKPWRALISGKPSQAPARKAKSARRTV